MISLPILVKFTLNRNGVPFFQNYQVTLSVILTAAGVLIAALGDFSFDLFGYSLAFISVFFQVICWYFIVHKSLNGAMDTVIVHAFLIVLPTLLCRPCTLCWWKNLVLRMDFHQWKSCSTTVFYLFHFWCFLL